MAQRTIGDSHRQIILASIGLTPAVLILLMSLFGPVLSVFTRSALTVVVALPLALAISHVTRAILARRFLAEFIAGPITLLPSSEAPATAAFSDTDLQRRASTFYVVASSGRTLTGPHTAVQVHDDTSLAIEGQTHDIVSELTNGSVVHTTNTGRVGPPAHALNVRPGASWDELMQTHRASLDQARSEGFEARRIDDLHAFFIGQEEAERQWISTQSSGDVVTIMFDTVKQSRQDA